MVTAAAAPALEPRAGLGMNISSWTHMPPKLKLLGLGLGLLIAPV